MRTHHWPLGLVLSLPPFHFTFYFTPFPNTHIRTHTHTHTHTRTFIESYETLPRGINIFNGNGFFLHFCKFQVFSSFHDFVFFALFQGVAFCRRDTSYCDIVAVVNIITFPFNVFKYEVSWRSSSIVDQELGRIYTVSTI